VRDAILVLAVLALFAAFEAALYGLSSFKERRSGELKRRLQAIGKAAALDADLLRRGRLARSAAVAHLVRGLPGSRPAERLLEQADFAWTVAQLYAYSAVALVAGLMVGVVLRVNVAGLLGLTLLSAAVPSLSVMIARSRRNEKLSEQLPEALEMMARSLRAGHALTSAFQVVAGEMPEPISIEFARAYEEQRLGLSLELAVQQMARRAPKNPDLKIFAVSTIIQRETGGNLAEILGNIADTIRQRYRFRGKLRALTGEGRASAVVLGALPGFVALVLSVVNPKYLRTLVETTTGRWILAYAVVSWAFGLLWLKSQTKVDL
jgi:tight adherence protein B